MPLVGGGVFALLLLVAVDGCRTRTPGTGPAPQPQWAPRPQSTPAPVAAAEASAPTLRMESRPDPVAVFDPDSVVAVLNAPALAAVKKTLAEGKVKEAANAFREHLAKAPPKEPTEVAASWYRIARLYEQAGDPHHAHEAYEKSAAITWPLMHRARVHAGRLLLGMNHPSQAVARLKAPGPGAPEPLRQLLLARALNAVRDVDAAGKVWGAYLAQQPRPKGWQSVALRYAKALLNRPSTARAEKAVQVARMVIYESPAAKGVGEARDLETQALASIPSSRRKQFTEPALATRMLRARQLSESRQATAARKAADELIKDLPNDQPSEVACEAFMARSRALGLKRLYADASTAAETAIERCTGNPRRVTALFLGGRYALRAGEPAVARRRYAALEADFPQHRFADDARLHGAEAAKNLGDAASAHRMLSRMADDYPKGDMVDDGLFALARANIEQDNWGGAIAPLRRAVAFKQRGRPYYAEGRPQYFLARALWVTGQKDEALATFDSVIRDFPLSYYMIQAYRRLFTIDRRRARRVLKAAMDHEPKGGFVIEDHADLHQPGFLRAVELVRQDDGKGARSELDALGVKDGSAHISVKWASAFLLARINATVQSHGVLRASTDVWNMHYPTGVWRPIWEVAFPRPHLDIVSKERKRSPISEALAYGIMREESAFQARVVSHAGAYGLMQLILPTAKHVGRSLHMKVSRERLKRPATNIALGCRFLFNLSKRFSFNPALAIPGYNAGPGAPRKWLKARPEEDFDLWIERIPYKETRHYTKRVLQSLVAYSVLYGKGMDLPILALPERADPRTLEP